jgi:hypothetical protein
VREDFVTRHAPNKSKSLISFSWRKSLFVLGRDLLISEASRPHSVGLLWTSDKPDAETWTGQLTETTFHALIRIRTYNHCKPAASIPRLRSRGRWDRQSSSLLHLHSVINWVGSTRVVLQKPLLGGGGCLKQPVSELRVTWVGMDTRTAVLQNLFKFVFADGPLYWRRWELKFTCSYY